MPPGLDDKLDRGPSAAPVIAYDPVHRIAYAFDLMGTPSVVGPASAPAFPVVRTDLQRVRLESGITIGTPARTVIAIMGKPNAQAGCGRQRFTYATGPNHDSVLLTIRAERVVAIDFFGDD